MAMDAKLEAIAIDHAIMEAYVKGDQAYESPSNQASQWGSEASEAWTVESENVSADNNDYPGDESDLLTIVNTRKIPQSVESGGSVQGICIGSGCGGQVYEHKKDPTKVIKISNLDKGYEEFIKWALDNQDNKHIPKIYAHHIDGDDVYIVLERLSPINREQVMWSIDFAYTSDLENQIKDPLKHLLTEEFLDTIEDLNYEHAELFGCESNDMHWQNVMLRVDADGTPIDFVITDPWYHHICAI
jgi:hypothetical protein